MQELLNIISLLSWSYLHTDADDDDWTCSELFIDHPARKKLPSTGPQSMDNKSLFLCPKIKHCFEVGVDASIRYRRYIIKRYLILSF